MNKIIPLMLTCIVCALQSSHAGFDSLTTAQLHQRLLNKDTLLILDVREFTTAEYLGNHIAEPAGQLPLTPACLPWNSGVFQAKYSRLPKNIDIIVHCASGMRSKKACTFLDSLGFTRIFNMLGGFNAWTFEKRSGSFGDHTGAWINSSFAKPATVFHDSASIILYPSCFAGLDSVYCEAHFASGKQPAPADVPASSVAGLFRITVLDKFGIPLFTGDSLALADTVGLSFIAHPKHGAAPTLAALMGKATWRTLTSDYIAPTVHRSERVLRRWYSIVVNTDEVIAEKRSRQNPAPHGYKTLEKPIKAFDVNGRLLFRANGADAYKTWLKCNTIGFFIIDRDEKTPFLLIR